MWEGVPKDSAHSFFISVGHIFAAVGTKVTVLNQIIADFVIKAAENTWTF